MSPDNKEYLNVNSEAQEKLKKMRGSRYELGHGGLILFDLPHRESISFATRPQQRPPQHLTPS